MKHAGRPRRGANRQGREKRRRRNEASLEARDEEPDPIGTCTPLGSSEQGRARSSGFRRRTNRASVRHFRRGSWRRTDGRSPMVQPRGEVRRWIGADAPSGERPRRVTEGLAKDWTRWVDAGRQGITSAPVFGWTQARFTSARGWGFGPGPSAGTRRTSQTPPFGWSPADLRRTVAPRPFPADGRSGPPTITATDSSVVGQWARDPQSVPMLERRLRVAGRSRVARGPQGRLRDLVPGGELSWVGALEGRRTSREGARDATGRRRPERDRAGAGWLVPEGRCKAMRGAMPTDTRSGRPSAGTRQGPAMPRT
jgi:hypothetical protein